MESDVSIHCNAYPAMGSAPLTGKSFAVQHNISVRGWRTEAGTSALREFVAVENATIVDRLRKADATIVAIDGMSELGFGPDGNAATAVLLQGRADMVLMTDMMGEARITAARTGIFAFKPTHGIVSRYGWIGLAPSMECCSLLARTPQEMACVMGVMAGEDERDFSLYRGEMPDFTSGARNARLIRKIGVARMPLSALSKGEAGAFRKALDRLGAMGLEVRDVDIADQDLFSVVHRVIGSVEASSSCGRYDGVRYGYRTAASMKNWNDMYLQSRGESFGMPLKAYLFQGAYFQFKNYAAFENAARIRARLVHNLEDLLTQVDVLISPTRRGAALKCPNKTVDDIYDECALTLSANVTGLPAVQIPGYVMDGDADLGLQVIGPRLSDARLLSLAVSLSHGT